ncbi:MULTISPECIES: SDR family oxidoreductase [Colwellia]|uniref:Acetoacetyl-CoA reductase n=1 Tax=Colwellia psychrerythraea (strain 34H / ATCC BAA-681) TaxID=167879 RepID=Q481D0_COLP3|nr:MULTISPECIES: SDR family oxidoreductase [Colwellia]AAZ24259.1 acetoacetyl-CoA reductase [Colwellia psychrerythraea 34H]PKH87605.1 NAD(P)-dependent oxidoreductase [Colwellia sp. Bg11-28]
MENMKIALVTGAIGGIGTEICRQLVKDGYKVLATHRPGKEDVAKQWLEDESFDSIKLNLLSLDVTDSISCGETLKQVMQDYGTIDVLVNNAGITRDSAFKRMTFDKWNDVINTNLNSLFNVTQPVFNPMCEKGSGRIINISSINGLKGQFGQANYAAAKAGMIGFSKSLALESARSGVTVNVIAPGYTATPMVNVLKDEILDSIKAQIPLRRLATPQEIAKAVSYLASDDAAYITGETLNINGGQYMH